MAILDYHDLVERIMEKRSLLMLDRAEIAADGRSASGIKCVSMDENFFLGHFPGSPIMPGVLQVTAMAQVGQLLLPRPADKAGWLPWMTGLKRIKFRKLVGPGDLLRVEAKITAEAPDGTLTLTAQTLVNGEVACQGDLMLRLVSPEALRGSPDALQPASCPVAEAAKAAGGQPVDIAGIMQVIPHRFPFLLIDRILFMDLQNPRIVGLKNVTGNESWFAALPVAALPLGLQVEMAAQLCCALALSVPENKGQLGLFMSIDDAKFHCPVVPGDQLIIEGVAVLRSRFGKADAKLYVGDRLVTEASMKFAVAPRGEEPAA
ncbi:MAG: hypothetical protein WC708_02705 [Lentisphaeria bacterium]